ncbi:MAG: PD40 domain-containing protein [Anaerolineae bacterium]|nr:PD40 domain-containing protein [Anaerolineae bacterium]
MPLPVLLIAVLLTAALLGTGLVPARAQDDPEAIRPTVQAWLLREISKPTLVLTQYSYEGTSWSDTGLGCPVEGATYQPGTVHGYRWTFEYDNHVSYEVHSSIDGGIAVLCSAVNAGSDISLTPYRTSTFAILSPESWLVFPGPNAEVVFGPQPGTACDQPGMRVVVVGRVASGVTPDQLIDEYLGSMGAADRPTERTTVGSFGRTTGYESACQSTTSSATQQRRVSTFIFYGIAYRVEQWAPLAESATWDPLFIQMVSQFGPPDAGIVSATPDAGGADTGGETGADTGEDGAAGNAADLGDLPPFPLTFIFVGDVFLGALNDIPGRSITITPDTERRYLGFSPDGLYIAYTNITDAQLRVMHATEGRSPRRLALDIRTDFPPAWSADSQWIAYVLDSGETDDNGAALLEVHAIHRISGEQRQVTSFAFGGDCSTDSTDPADRLYDAETGGYVLAWLTHDRVLVSTRCDGGLALINPADGSRIDLGPDLTSGVLAPDHHRFAARTAEGLVIVDFDTFQSRSLMVGTDAQQIAWSADGQTLYYATAAPRDTATLDDPDLADRGEAVFGVWPVTVAVYDLTLVQVDVTSGAETLLWQSQGRGIGRIAPAPDGSGVLFSQISSSLLVAEAFQSGADQLALDATWPQPALYWLPASGERGYLLAFAGQPAFAPITVGP